VATARDRAEENAADLVVDHAPRARLSEATKARLLADLDV
jgi:hypothetical protein